MAASKVMLKFKFGVKLDALQPQMVLAVIVIEAVYSKYGYDCFITSANDSSHKAGSLHYKGRALDFRLNSLKKEDREKVVGDVAVFLGEDYDILHESPDTANEHLHVEYDPKR